MTIVEVTINSDKVGDFQVQPTGLKIDSGPELDLSP